MVPPSTKVFLAIACGRPRIFAKLTDPNYAYDVMIQEAEQGTKVPAWLNDPIYYHNRGDTTFEGENSLYGDFVGLDDLFTEHPRVVDGHDRYFRRLDRTVSHRRFPHRHGAACEQ